MVLESILTALNGIQIVLLWRISEKLFDVTQTLRRVRRLAEEEGDRHNGLGL